MTVIRTLRAQEAAPWPVYQQPPMRCPDNKKGNNELDEPIVLRCNELLLIVVLRSLFRDCLRPVERRLFTGTLGPELMALITLMNFR